MLNAAAWTCGLFLVGLGVVQLFPGPFVEPLVLLALGAALYLVSARLPARRAATEDAPGEDAALEFPAPPPTTTDPDVAPGVLPSPEIAAKAQRAARRPFGDTDRFA